MRVLQRLLRGRRRPPVGPDRDRFLRVYRQTTADVAPLLRAGAETPAKRAA
jgi:hypothetical protein